VSNQNLSIFISHPSDFLTDNKLHGDGLAAFEFINRLAKRGHKLYVAVSSFDIKSNINHNIKLFQVNKRFGYSFLEPLLYIHRVNNLFKKLSQQYSIDLIHQLNPVSPALSYSISNKNVPVVLGLFVPGWPTNSEPSRIKAPTISRIIGVIMQSIIKQLDIRQQRGASALLLSTTTASSRLYEFDLVKYKTHILPYGVDTDLFSPKINSADVQSDNKQSILFLGRLARQKGIFTLLTAFQEVVKILPSTRLIIAGYGPDDNEVKGIVSKMQCKLNIDMLGNIARDEVPKVIRNSTVCCIPSYGEPFGLVALEAMSCGKPVVATNAGGLAELVTENGGHKVIPGDVKSLSNALIELLSNYDLTIKMGEYNRRLVESNYSWDVVINRLESIYYEVLKKN